VDRGNPRQIVLKTPVSETTRVKWTGGAAQAVECLLCNCEALNSNPSSTEKKKKNPKNRFMVMLTGCFIGVDRHQNESSSIKRKKLRNTVFFFSLRQGLDV
jgi:hypothetical protein